MGARLRASHGGRVSGDMEHKRTTIAAPLHGTMHHRWSWWHRAMIGGDAVVDLKGSYMSAIGMTLSLWAASIKGATQYRANFVIMVVMGLVYQGTGFAFIWVVLSRFERLAGWTLGEIAFLYGLRLTIHAIDVLVEGNIRGMDDQIRRGEFDRYLLRPMPPLLQIMGNEVQINAFGDLLGGLVLFGVAITLVDIAWTPLHVLYLVLAMVGGALLEMALNLIVGTLGFRFLNTGALLALLDNFFSEFGNYPLRIFGATVQWLLTFGLPLAFMAYFPATVLLGRTGELSVHPVLAYAAPVVGVLWWLAAVAFFRHELRRYESAGH
jgi:ABC-2 type transport system permease protein